MALREIRKKEYKLANESFMFSKMKALLNTDELKKHMKAIYKECIAEVKKEKEDKDE